MQHVIGWYTEYNLLQLKQFFYDVYTASVDVVMMRNF